MSHQGIHLLKPETLSANSVVMILVMEKGKKKSKYPKFDWYGPPLDRSTLIPSTTTSSSSLPSSASSGSRSKTLSKSSSQSLLSQQHSEGNENIYYESLIIETKEKKTILRLGDCVLLASTSPEPYVAEIQKMYSKKEQKCIETNWFYRPGDIPKYFLDKISLFPNEIFASRDTDTNYVESILRPCVVRYVSQTDSLAVTPTSLPHGEFLCRYKYEKKGNGVVRNLVRLKASDLMEWNCRDDLDGLPQLRSSSRKRLAPTTTIGGDEIPPVPSKNRNKHQKILQMTTETIELYTSDATSIPERFTMTETESNLNHEEEEEGEFLDQIEEDRDRLPFSDSISPFSSSSMTVIVSKNSNDDMEMIRLSPISPSLPPPGTGTETRSMTSEYFDDCDSNDQQEEEDLLRAHSLKYTQSQSQSQSQSRNVSRLIPKKSSHSLLFHELYIKPNEIQSQIPHEDDEMRENSNQNLKENDLNQTVPFSTLETEQNFDDDITSNSSFHYLKRFSKHSSRIGIYQADIPTAVRHRLIHSSSSNSSSNLVWSPSQSSDFSLLVWYLQTAKLLISRYCHFLLCHGENKRQFHLTLEQIKGLSDHFLSGHHSFLTGMREREGEREGELIIDGSSVCVENICEDLLLEIFHISGYHSNNALLLLQQNYLSQIVSFWSFSSLFKLNTYLNESSQSSFDLKDFILNFPDHSRHSLFRYAHRYYPHLFDDSSLPVPSRVSRGFSQMNGNEKISSQYVLLFLVSLRELFDDFSFAQFMNSYLLYSKRIITSQLLVSRVREIYETYFDLYFRHHSHATTTAHTPTPLSSSFSSLSSLSPHPTSFYSCRISRSSGLGLLSELYHHLSLSFQQFLICYQHPSHHSPSIS